MDKQYYILCPLHEETCYAFCNDCNKLICSCCEGHKSHSVSRLDKFLDDNEEQIPSAASLMILLPQLESKYEEVKKKLAEGKVKHHEIVERLRMCNEMKSNSEAIIDNDLKILQKILECLKESDASAKTQTLKKLCEEALDKFSAETSVRAEVINSFVSRENLKKKKGELSSELMDLQVVMKQLEYAMSGIKSKALDDRAQLSIILLNKRGLTNVGTVQPTSGTGGYKAFPSVDKVFDMKQVMSQRLIDVGRGVLISTPVMVNKNFLGNGGYCFYSTISHNGILAIHSYHIQQNLIQFTNLLTNEQVTVNVSGAANIAFYDDKAIALITKEPLREGPVSEIFRRQDISALGYIGRVGVNCVTDTSLVHYSRVLFYRSKTNAPYKFNVDTKEEALLMLSQRPCTFGCLMGLDLGVQTVYQDNVSHMLYAYKDNGTASNIDVGIPQGMLLMDIYASSSDPQNLQKAVYKWNSSLYYQGELLFKDMPILFEQYRSIVRLSGDIFLIFHWGWKCWILSRIVVP